VNIHVNKGSGPNSDTAKSQDFEDFIYLISHDVRNSVRALIEVPQWIAEDLEEAGHRLEGPVGDHISLMNTHTRRLDRMLNDLLVYSRIGRMQTVREVDLLEAIDAVCQEMRFPAGIKLKLDLQATELRIGERDILTLLIALFSNSIRHRDAKTSEIVVSSENQAGETILRVCDNGPGIARIHREKIFSAMTTLKSRDEVEGSGMGLAHVRKILNVYGANLEWLDLPDDRGVGFEMRFPV
jgi:signal transduction histidine kinase